MFKPQASSLTSMHLFKKALLAFLTTLFFLNSPALGAQQIERKKVLVLFSFRPTLPVASQWDRGIRSVFEANKAQKPVINIEHLDLTHFGDKHHVQLLLDLYRHKYSNPKPDLIIPVLNGSVDLMLKYGANLFPDVPIVFGGVEKQFIESRSVPSNITGYFTDINYTGTLELALNLHPKTRNIAVVAGTGPIVRKWINSCRKAYQTYEDRFDFIYLTGLPMEKLLYEVENLPPNTIVISLPVLIDGTGKKFVGNESLAQITKASVAPVYTFWDVCLGTGVVGGYLGSFEEEAKAVAKLGLRILNGENPGDIPVIKAPKYLTLFDWHQLKRWSIPEEELPPGSIVKFKEFTVWDSYKTQIVGALALMFVQILIISYLLYQHKIRRQSEEELSQTELKFRTVADYTYDWEYWQKLDGSFRYVSPSCERICGYTAQDFIKNPSLLQDIILPGDKEAWDEHNCSAQEEMKSAEIQFRIQKPDGEIRWIEHACQPVLDRQGNNQGVRASNRDITKRKHYKSETLQLQSDLAHMDRVVTISALTSALAHEINQPLAAMRSYAQAALRFMDTDQPKYDSVRKALQGIVEDNKRAAAVVNRLRGLMKKGTGHEETLEINSIINAVINLINSEIVMRNASVTLDLHPNPPVVIGDSIQIQQVLINLLMNALDAVNEQPVEARTITISTKSENPNATIISISDSGEGIPPDRIQAVFDPFHTSKSEGMGLGLAICKTIIEAHGGKIWVEDNPNGGGTFSFTLPVRNKKQNT